MTAAAPSTPLTAAERDMVAANLGLIGWTLSRYFPHLLGPATHDDAYQDGLFGLARAAQKFEPERGHQFSTYAVTWIRQAIGRGREIEEGRNYRAARRKCVEYVAPLYIDAETVDRHYTGSGENHFLVASLAAADDVEADGTFTALRDGLAAHLLHLCADDIDRAVAAQLLAGARYGDAVVATELGLPAWRVRAHRLRLQDAMRRSVAA